MGRVKEVSTDVSRPYATVFSVGEQSVKASNRGLLLIASLKVTLKWVHTYLVIIGGLIENRYYEAVRCLRVAETGRESRQTPRSTYNSVL